MLYLRYHSYTCTNLGYYSFVNCHLILCRCRSSQSRAEVVKVSYSVLLQGNSRTSRLQLNTINEESVYKIRHGTDFQ